MDEDWVTTFFGTYVWDGSYYNDDVNGPLWDAIDMDFNSMSDNSKFVSQCLEVDSSSTAYTQWDVVCETVDYTYSGSAY